MVVRAWCLACVVCCMEFERVICRCDGSFWDSGGREWRRGGIGVAVALGVMAGICSL